MKFEIKQLIIDFYNSAWFTGGAGAIASAIFNSEKVGFGRRLGYIAIGMLIAAYGAPAVVDWMGIEKESVANAIVFLLGALGVWIMGGMATFGKELVKNPGQAIKNLRNIWRNGDSNSNSNDK